MLATAFGQVGFFDAAELARPLPEGSLFALLAEAALPIACAGSSVYVNGAHLRRGASCRRDALGEFTAIVAVKAPGAT